jgi:hypothetical protein
MPSTTSLREGAVPDCAAIAAPGWVAVTLSTSGRPPSRLDLLRLPLFFATVRSSGPSRRYGT